MNKLVLRPSSLKINRNFRERLNIFWQSPEKVFLYLAIVFGILTVFAMPLFMGPDEPAHFDRAYQIASSGFVSSTTECCTGGYMPKTLNLYMSQFGDKVAKGEKPILSMGTYLTSRVDKNGSEFTDFRASAIYSPVTYIPQAIGIFLAKAIYPTVGVMEYIARLFGLAAYILMVYYAIKIATYGKWVFVVLALFPVSIQQASTMSGDIMTIGLAFLLIAYTQKLFFSTNKIRKKDLIALLVLSVAIVLTKQTNIILLVPLIFLPNRLFGSFLNKVKYLTPILLIAVISAAAWYLLTKYLNFNVQISRQAGVNQALQVAFIQEHPLDFFRVIWHTFAGPNSIKFYLSSMHGLMSWHTYRLPMINAGMGYIALLLAFLSGFGKKTVIDFKLKTFALVNAATLLVSVTVIATVLYISWSIVAQPVVQGIQGRYFIPLVPLLIPLFMIVTKYIKVTYDNNNRLGQIVTIVSALNLTTMIYMTIKWFS